ncbi:facilitated trehalose transporter Tret1 isoform X3 [Achroia grisella]|uniref:facilitated trehalose transporter Tret1 isoform X3 n=2 Tax=Achroia grisella TaxID=688607 RepID=UPI0027D21237|nr:facilitated trehalose transporter Tret1 isoform X3 [Achroia grisella]
MLYICGCFVNLFDQLYSSALWMRYIRDSDVTVRSKKGHASGQYTILCSVAVVSLREYHGISVWCINTDGVGWWSLRSAEVRYGEDPQNENNFYGDGDGILYTGISSEVLTYVAEITQPHLRGALTATSSLCIILGVFTQFLFGLFLYWRTVALVNIVFTILAVVALCFVPESPHWLVSKKRHNDAQKSLQWLRGWTNASAVEEELKDIQNLYKRKKVELQDEEESFTEKITHYLERSFYVPFALISFSFFVGHFSGMTTLQTFAVSIFQRLQAPIDKYYATLIIGILQILGTAVCVLLVHYTGKRPLTFFSTGGAAVCCYFVAAYDGYLKYDGVPQTTEINATTATDSFIDDMGNSYSWIPTTLLMLLALLTHTGIRLLPWILIGEIFSAKTRSGGAGLASAVGYIFGFFANKLYIDMVERLDLWGTYGLYGIVCTLGCIIFYFTLPETEGKKLSDIENHFAGVKRLTNTVYRSKKIPNQEDAKMRDLKGAVNSAFEPENSQL